MTQSGHQWVALTPFLNTIRSWYDLTSKPQGEAMRRREFITILGSAVVVWPLSAHAQQGERMRSIGVLTPLPADLPDAQARHAVFLQALRQLGWTEGGNVRIEAPLVRW